MHAVVVNVTIDPGQLEIARKSLREQVVPRVSKAPGFVKGYWTGGADTNGLSLVVFATKQDAENAANIVRSSPPPPGVTMNSVEIREVVAEA